MGDLLPRMLGMCFVILSMAGHDAICIGEQAKRARHSLVCSIENRGYIIYYIYIVRANFVLITR